MTYILKVEHKFQVLEREHWDINILSELRFITLTEPGELRLSVSQHIRHDEAVMSRSFIYWNELKTLTSGVFNGHSIMGFLCDLINALDILSIVAHIEARVS